MEEILKRAETVVSRRSFAKLLGAAGALSLIETSAIVRAFAESKHSIPWLAAQTASGEGFFTNLKIEGKIPASLNGTLFRTAPGQSENHGTQLRHLFDGDAFLSAWQFENGRINLQARFLDTPQRTEESQVGAMLYGEFGTPAPARSSILAAPKYAGKNQPNINIIRWHDKLLGLSEGSLATVINPKTLTYEGNWNFGNNDLNKLTFTAHPRFCPKTGDGYAWGFERGSSGMHVLRLDAQTGKAETLYKQPLDAFYMAHDAMLTENYLMIVVPPMRYDLGALLTGKAATVAEALKYYENEPAQLFVFPRDNKNGAAQPVVINLLSHLVFHHGNAFETPNGQITLDTIFATDRRLLDVLANWKLDRSISYEKQKLMRLTIDLGRREIVGRTEIGENVEFPRYDARLTANNARYLYAVERGYADNAAIVRFDLHKQTERKAFAGANRTFGEPVFVPRGNVARLDEERGWLLTQGYDAVRDETFLDVRDAATLESAARVWVSGQHFPLGFHGNFYQS